MKALEVEGLKKTYKNGVVALNGISFAVEEGDFFALLGPNGAGKSTTIGIIMSLVNKTSGIVRVFEREVDEDPYFVKSSIGLVPQEFNFNPFEKVLVILLKQAGYYGINRKEAMVRCEKYLKKVGLWGKRNEQARSLSGGQKRRLMIVRALINEPKLLILDEPTAGVDVELRHLMWRFLSELNKEGKTIILTTHYLEEAEQLCKNVAIIDCGKLMEHDSLDSLLQKARSETFVFNFDKPIQSIPEMIFPYQQLDKRTLEIELGQGHSLNQLFCIFEKHGLEVISMRNKINRLEELFINLTSEKKDEPTDIKD